MNKYQVSIIVPIYNTEKYLRRCVETLSRQTYKELEILLVDDGSTDGSGRLCDELALTDTRIRVVHKENGGLISAWKRGVEESRGSYLCFMDSDDWVELNMIEEMTEHLSGSAREIISSDYVIEREDGSRQFVWQTLPAGEYNRQGIKEKVIPQLLGNEQRTVCFSRCMKLISRELIEENCKYSNPAVKMAEDVIVMLPSLIDCERLVIMDHKAYYHYLYLSSSMVHRYDRGLYENVLLLRKITLQILQDKFDGSQLVNMRESADREFIFMLFLVLKNEARGNPSGYKKNIVNICKQPEIRQLCMNTPVKVEEKANKLLYLVLKHPNGFTVRLLRLAMVLYYRR